MNLRRWLSVILMGALVVALSAPSALAWTNRFFPGHNPNFRGFAPHGPAYGWHGQRPGWNHGNAYGWQHRGLWNHRNAFGSNHRGFWRHDQRYGHFRPVFGRPYGSHFPYHNARYYYGPRR